MHTSRIPIQAYLILGFDLSLSFSLFAKCGGNVRLGYRVKVAWRTSDWVGCRLPACNKVLIPPKTRDRSIFVTRWKNLFKCQNAKCCIREKKRISTRSTDPRCCRKRSGLWYYFAHTINKRHPFACTISLSSLSNPHFQQSVHQSINVSNVNYPLSCFAPPNLPCRQHPASSEASAQLSKYKSTVLLSFSQAASDFNACTKFNQWILSSSANAARSIRCNSVRRLVFASSAETSTPGRPGPLLLFVDLPPWSVARHKHNYSFC